jgi:hypothetical protein
MKARLLIIAAALCAFSCQSLIEEWQPVFTFNYGDGAEFVPVNMDADVNCSIAELKALYTTHGKPVQVASNLIIKGQVTSSDEDGNVYREIYIQDATGGLDVKIGRSSSYDDFKVGQIVYIKCYGLVLGEYGYKPGNYGGDGLLQLGYVADGFQEYSSGASNTAPEYETAYLDLLPIVNKHIFRGRILSEADRIQPDATLRGADLTKDENVSRLVRLNNVKYGNSVGGKEIFCLFYPDPNLNHTKNESWNRVFLASPTDRVNGADYTFNIKTWALTKLRFHAHVEAGDWDSVEIGDGSGTVATAKTKIENFGYEQVYKQVILEHPGAQSVSHYFMYDGTEVQVRTSGYARFADVEIPADVLDGSKNLDFVGILSRYQGSAQFTLLDVYYTGTTTSLIK